MSEHMPPVPPEGSSEGPEQPGHLPPACAAGDADLPALALGTLSGKARVAALAHLDQCARCSAEVEELSMVADHLVHLAPEAEPPIGFEARVFERLGLLQPSSLPAPWYRRVPKWAVGAAAALALLVFGAGALIGRGTTTPPPAATSTPVQETALISSSTGKDVGEVYVYAGNPTWLFMVINGSDWQGTLRCEVIEEDGSPIVLGRFWLADGKGAWSESVNEPAGRLMAARVIGANGQSLAWASLQRLE